MLKGSASARGAVQKILLTQCAITLLAAAASFFFVDGKAAYSAGVGGGISIIITAYFARHVFSAGAGSSAKAIARVFYVGEAIKIALTALLFYIAIAWLNVSFLPLFLTYAVTLMAYWLVLPFTLDSPVKNT